MQSRARLQRTKGRQGQHPSSGSGRKPEGAPEDIGEPARGDGENIAGGKYFSSFREPTSILMSPISMNRCHAQATQANTQPRPGGIPIDRWEETHCAVPILRRPRREPDSLPRDARGGPERPALAVQRNRSRRSGSKRIGEPEREQIVCAPNGRQSRQPMRHQARR
jgi:hypothetical protein